MSIHGLFSDFYNTPSYSSDAYGYGVLAAGVIFFLIFLLIILFVLVAVTIASRWIFFKKCGEQGWKAIIPVYNEITLLKVCGMNWWWIFILLGTSILSSINSSISSFSQSYESIGLAMISLFFSLIVLAASVFTILTRIGMAINITKKFHKSGGYAALIVLFEPIMFFILGLSKDAVYDDSVKVSQHGIFGPKPSN